MFTVMVMTKNNKLEANTYLSVEADLLTRKLQSQGYEIIELRRFETLDQAQACKNTFRSMNETEISSYLK